jgi:uncharacterized protein (UPF0332 family)
MIVKVKSDRQKSEALKRMAQITLERLEKTEIEKYPSNTLIDYYDIIHKLLEALALKGGVKVKGDGSHQELIEFVVKRYNLGEQTRRFLQQMRDFRNRISYEGFMIHRNYVSLNKEKIASLIEELFGRLD